MIFRDLSHLPKVAYHCVNNGFSFSVLLFKKTSLFVPGTKKIDSQHLGYSIENRRYLGYDSEGLGNGEVQLLWQLFR